jgi:hypothetical protein
MAAGHQVRGVHGPSNPEIPADGPEVVSPGNHESVQDDVELGPGDTGEMRPIAHRRSIHPLAVGSRQVQRLRGESRVRGGTAPGGT